MIKDAFYFAHDSNARHDPKIVKMLTKYKYGYQWYFMIIEILREQVDYKYRMDEFAVVAIAKEINENEALTKNFLSDCCQKFHLLKRNKHYLWSESLIKRMQQKDEKREKLRKNALSRWGKEECKSNAIALQEKKDCTAIAKQDKIREEKIREEKIREEKIGEDMTLSSPLSLRSDSYNPQKLFADSEYSDFKTFETHFTNHPDFNNYDAGHYFAQLRDWSASKNQTSADWISTVYSWIRRDNLKEQAVKKKEIKETFEQKAARLASQENEYYKIEKVK